MTAFKGGLREQSVTEMFLLRRTRGRGGSFGTAELGAGRGRPQPSLLFRLVWFWMGCSSCPRTRPVETCAGSVRSELEDDRPPCKTQEEDLRGNKTSVHENTGKQTIVQGNEKKSRNQKRGFWSTMAKLLTTCLSNLKLFLKNLLSFVVSLVFISSIKARLNEFHQPKFKKWNIEMWDEPKSWSFRCFILKDQCKKNMHKITMLV